MSKDIKVNAKAMRILGDVMLSSDKAMKMLGETEKDTGETEFRRKLLFTWRPKIKKKLNDKFNKTRYIYRCTGFILFQALLPWLILSRWLYSKKLILHNGKQHAFF